MLSRAVTGLLAAALAGCAAQTKPLALDVPSHAVAPAPAPTVVADPVARPPPLREGYVTMTVLGVGARGVIALVDPTQSLVVPIYVGGSEAASASHRFHTTRPPRPLTHDLMDALMRDLGAEIYRAQVDALENGTYIGTLVVAQKGRYIELDARPSDAIALAMGAKAPIVVADAVLKKAGVPKASFHGLDDEDELQQLQQSAGGLGAGTSAVAPSANPPECDKARLLKRLGRPEWTQAAAVCVSKGGTP